MNGENTQDNDKNDVVCQDNSEAVGLLLSYAQTSRNAPASSVQEARIQANCVAAAWIDYLLAGNPVPDRQTLILLLKAMIQSGTLEPALIATPGIKLVQADTNTNKFPHMIDTANGSLAKEDGIWMQCKTKMTHFTVRLCDSDGNAVKGVDVQEGGLELRLTLYSSSDATRPLTDDDNPRPWEGLFLGRSSQAFDDTVTLMESRHTFRFMVMILSSDVGGSQFFLKVSPVHPSMAFDPNLTVRSHSFHSRARMPDVTYKNGDGKRQRVSDSGSGGNAAGEGSGE